MRTIVVVTIALAAMSLTSTFANAGTWCGTYKLGSTSCGYSSSEECLATVRGLGGFCQPNPFPGTAYGTSAGSWNPPDSPRRFSNRPFRVKHFQTVHLCGVDVARRLALLFGIGTRALPSWDSKIRWNNL